MGYKAVVEIGIGSWQLCKL